MTVPLLTDYLCAGPAIRERLQETFPDIPVKGAAELADLAAFESRAVGDLTLFCGYEGDRVPEAVGLGVGQLPAQRWGVVIAVRSRIDPLGRTGIEALAGPIIMTMLRALQGWRITPLHGPLARVPGPGARYGVTFAYFPYVFETTVPVIGTST